jgi:hypothetical protein
VLHGVRRKAWQWLNVNYVLLKGICIMSETGVYKIRGSHRDERNIKSLLGFDPKIHSGMAGKGAFCAHLTQQQHALLTDNGFKVNKRAIR